MSTGFPPIWARFKLAVFTIRIVPAAFAVAMLTPTGFAGLMFLAACTFIWV